MLLVRVVTTVVISVTDCRRWRAVEISALESSGATMPSSTGRRLIGFVFTVWLSVALPEPGNAFLVSSTASMLSSRAVGDTSLAVSREVELIGTRAFVAWSSFFDVSFNVQVS